MHKRLSVEIFTTGVNGKIRFVAHGCHLGGGSMGSTTWDIDRNYTAHLLGFDAPVDNSIDCVASRDFATDILSADSPHMSSQ